MDLAISTNICGQGPPRKRISAWSNKAEIILLSDLILKSAHTEGLQMKPDVETHFTGENVQV